MVHLKFVVIMAFSCWFYEVDIILRYVFNRALIFCKGVPRVCIVLPVLCPADGICTVCHRCGCFKSVL